MHIENAFLGPWKLHHECRLKKSALLQEDSTKPLCIYFNYMWNSWEKKKTKWIYIVCFRYCSCWSKINLNDYIKVILLLKKIILIYSSFIFPLRLSILLVLPTPYVLLPIHYAALRQMKSNGLCNFKSSSRSVGWCFRPGNRLAKLNVSNL